MANWLKKSVTPAKNLAKKPSLPAQSGGAGLPSFLTGPRGSESLPNASIVYGVAAGALLVVALYFLFTGKWFTGFLVLLLAGCFFGFAFHFIRYRK